MEIELLILTSLLLTVIIPLAQWFLHSFKGNALDNLPPGRMGWPIIGETLEFFTMGKKGIPEKFIQDRMNKYSSQVFKTSLLGEPMVVFCGPTANKFVFSNEYTLVRSWWPHSFTKIFPIPGPSIGEESAKMKTFLQRFFNTNFTHRYVSVIDLIAKKQLNCSWNHRDCVFVMPLAKKYTFSIACRLILGIDREDFINDFFNRYERIVVGLLSMPLNIPGSSYFLAVKASKLIRKELVAIIQKRKIGVEEKRIAPTQDLLSHMLNDPEEKEVFTSEEELASKIAAMLVASYDVTGRVLTFLVKYLAELPDVYNQVLKEQTEILKNKGEDELLNWEDIKRMRYSTNVLNEVLRLIPPTQGTFREAITDITYAGFTIPKGWKIYWNVYSTHKNQEYFPDPEKFDPSRFEGKGPAPYTYVPFGGGPRQCPGIQYGRTQILVFLHNLVTTFKWEKLIPDEEKTVDPMPKTTAGLPIRLWRHEPKLASDPNM